MMIKGTINWEDETILNLYTPNTIASKYIKQNSVDLKGKWINPHSQQIFNIPPQAIDRQSSPKFSKSIKHLSNKLMKIDRQIDRICKYI